ncbi:peptidoglycan-binding domain-containing protein [Leptothoe spongobia]|uniref:Peptidoglycan-binding protein n=1 Tax=Leptothoe spongobia TAU-MAC 1115 TaxID=1967444 RepID=A0A947DFU4_9CYAN|nr:peptidoglycan-binding protein [Leptothoe spongobia]MBT9315629.1 peptidoglycan-binding protein [Leptothoe spongobia TAU-MAC 1115]
MLYLLDMITLGQQDMSISGLFATTRHTARFSVKLFLGVWLLGAPAMAQTPSQFESPILMAQRQTILREGDRGAAVRELQQSLDSNGLFPAAIDGVYGSETTRAVRQFQRIRGLEVTGIADDDTLDELGVDLDRLTVGLSHPEHGFISGDRVTPDSSSEDVRTLQQVLRMFGFDLDTDGIYGGQTEQAVRAYERTAGLSVDGIADRTTLLDMGFSTDSRNFRDDRRTNSRDRSRRSPSDGVGSSRSSYGRYVAAIIAGPSELSNVRQDFPNATVERNNQGEYISIGRFVEHEDADDWADFASDLGYEARVLRD